MNKQFFILIGRSGCGKGTQADLLKQNLLQEGIKEVLHITTGGGFRDFIMKDNYVANLAKKVNDSGGLQPEFLAVWNWSNIFINTLKGDETVIFDGAPRKAFEVDMLHSAVSFFGYLKPIVIYIDVSEGWARERLLGRGREDDKEKEGVENRMNWFETDVLSAIDIYMHDPRYDFIHINGEKTIEEVHKDIINKLATLA